MVLIPKKLTGLAKKRIFNIIAMAASKPEFLEVNENSTREEIEVANMLNSFMLDCSIRQYELPDLPNGKIVLTKEVYDKLCSSASMSNLTNDRGLEYGRMLYGRETAPNQILFEETNYHKMRGADREVTVPNELVNEMHKVIRESDADVIAHIHTHPFLNGHYSSFPSNQDLYTCAHLQLNFNDTDKEVSFLGGLITPFPSTNSNNRFNDLCFMFYDKFTREFYKCDNIYYLNENEEEIPLFKITYEHTDNQKRLVLKEERTLLQNLMD